ncbi:MAG: thiamine phosphate synthase [Rhodanobacter sp.]|jgi:thiamine-phosphate pyrophosphorylase|nr:thiamine phosphate synthase [Rhodanobacter sp.]
MNTSHPRAVHGLYAISDGPRADLIQACTAALAGGATVLQYRDKTADAARRHAEAAALRAVCARYGALLIVNDDIELAASVCADGVHLGEDDASLTDARRRLGANAIIGVSCYDSLERARDFVTAGADYLAFGAFFVSSTKPRARHATLQLLRDARPLGIPLVAIGGITPGNARELIQAGADALAVISAVFGARDIHAAAREFSVLFGRPSPSPALEI